MGLFSFIADAGEKLLGGNTSGGSTSHGSAAGGSTSGQQSAAASAPQPDVAALNSAAAAAIARYVASQNLTAQNLDIKYDGASKTVTVSGVAPDQATKEKIVLCCGNVSSVAKVDDRLTVAKADAAASTFYEVKSGDSLSKIAKALYGDANLYTRIFDANRPMLSDPNKIYPGQQLRIPAAAPVAKH
jgi:nucleoid-associated protein YgaU